MEKTAKIFVAGHKGLVGSAITRALRQQGYQNLLLRDRSTLDLKNQMQVEHFFSSERPDYVFLAAAKVGGIHANNTYRADFIYDNLIIQANIINAAKQHETKKLLFLGSSCIYPKDCPQPMKEEYLLTGPLEKTNEPYAVAKIAGIKLCEAYNDQYGTHFAAVMPTNLYGPYDNFDLTTSHVLPALLRKVHEAKIKNAKNIVVWGTGAPKREFLHVDDMASACLYFMQKEDFVDLVNVGCGQEITIKALAELISDVVGFNGEITFDSTKPDGTLRKLLDLSKQKQLGWESKISLREGIENTYHWFLRTCS